MWVQLGARPEVLVLTLFLFPLPALAVGVVDNSGGGVRGEAEPRCSTTMRMAQKELTPDQKKANWDQLEKLSKGLPGKAPSTTYQLTPDEQSGRGKERAIQRFDENRKLDKLESIEKAIK